VVAIRLDDQAKVGRLSKGDRIIVRLSSKAWLSSEKTPHLGLFDTAGGAYVGDVQCLDDPDWSDTTAVADCTLSPDGTKLVFRIVRAGDRIGQQRYPLYIRHVNNLYNDETRRHDLMNAWHEVS
jgi:hypothetical protein